MLTYPRFLVSALLAISFALLVGNTAAGGGTPQPAWASLHRPLRATPLPEGSACPVSHLRALDQKRLRGPGVGPVYPIGGVDVFSAEEQHPDWIASKTIWAWPQPLIERATRVLVQGIRLDGQGETRFQLGPQWHTAPFRSELRLVTNQTVGSFSDSKWGTTVTLIFVREPGCNALQLDSARGSSTIVIEAQTSS
jgi:hypothetical protein